LSHLFDAAPQSFDVRAKVRDVRLERTRRMRCRAQTCVLALESGIVGLEISGYVITIGRHRLAPPRRA